MRLLRSLLSLLILAVALLAAETTQGAKTQAATLGATAIVFGQKGCPPCERMKAVVRELRKEGYKVAYLDLADYPDAVEDYGIRVTPTTFFARNMEIVLRVEGFISEQRFKEYFQETKARRIRW